MCKLGRCARGAYLRSRIDGPGSDRPLWNEVSSNVGGSVSGAEQTAIAVSTPRLAMLMAFFGPRWSRRRSGLGATVLLAAFAAGTVAAQTPSILLEACNAMEPASKRLECLRAANGTRPGVGAAYGGSTTPRAAYVAPQASSPSAAPRSTSSQTCYTGPRGGTYTITASGRKNYSGC